MGEESREEYIEYMTTARRRHNVTGRRGALV